MVLNYIKICGLCNSLKWKLLKAVPVLHPRKRYDYSSSPHSQQKFLLNIQQNATKMCEPKVADLLSFPDSKSQVKNIYLYTYVESYVY